ncbi:MAG: tRNA glutamyl-Q synthetase [Cyclobacteriaceae bacterium]
MVKKADPIVSRLAPTPSGYLHIGNVFSFVLTWLLVRQNGGRLHLRIDDLDKERVRKEYLENIFETLDWLGLSYDSGPTGVEDFVKNHSQYLRMDMYRDAFDELKVKADLFSCTCSRRQLAGKPYTGTCYANVRIGKDKNIRIRTRDVRERDDSLLSDQKIALNDALKDFIVWRKNDVPSYQLASLVDDMYYNTNYVVRGTGLLASTAAQLLLAEKISAGTFLQATFIHHPLLTIRNEKISKSQDHPSVFEEFRTPRDVFIYIGRILGLSEDESESLDLLRANFNFEKFKHQVNA